MLCFMRTGVPQPRPVFQSELPLLPFTHPYPLQLSIVSGSGGTLDFRGFFGISPLLHIEQQLLKPP